MKSLVLTVPVVVVIAIPILSQIPAGARPSFEVASIKPNTSGESRVSILGSPGGLYRATGVPLRMLMTSAYRVRDFQVIGGPGWMISGRWDIEARAADGAIPPGGQLPDPNHPDPMSLMVQSLLEDRFQLKFHRETKDLPIYELMIGKGGSKLKSSEDQSPLRLPDRGGPPPPRPQPGAPMPRGSMRMGRGDLEASGLPLASFISALSQQLGRTIVDKTGLQGLYDIKLQWTPDAPPAATGVVPGGPGGVRGPNEPPPPDPAGPTIFTAIQEQLGLRLESTKGPVVVLVIDSVERPTAN